MMKSEGIYIRRRVQLVEEIRSKGISDERVLEAIGRVPRELFVEGALQHRAYEDLALPIGLNQTISQPSTVAFQTMLLEVQPGDFILEVGTGSGYQAAILCEMGVRLFSIERHHLLHMRAKLLLNQLQYRALLRVGDGSLGWPSLAPFDAIIVTAGAMEIPSILLSQLREPTDDKPGGRLIVPVGDREGQSMMKMTRTGPESYDSEQHGRFIFVPLVSDATSEPIR